MCEPPRILLLEGVCAMREHMGHTTFEELRKKDVVNICDGRKLGRICDMEIDIAERIGQVTAIIVPGQSKLFGILRSDEELVIPYQCINKFGDDVILVEIQPKP